MSLPPPSVKDLFFSASSRRDAVERAAYLDEVCGRGTDLRRRVEALLAAESRVTRFLESPLVTSPIEFDRVVRAEEPGEAIGPYRLMESIGEGGMGVVYLAEQGRPVRRRVALKIIKPGMDTRQVIARFDAERQALAMMDHPNIARVIDGGATPSGRSYFVMDLVPGAPITEFCDRERLDVGRRIELFILVCRAVEHAHQKGIIHRDLKPSNILVTTQDGVPVPRVIDFGIAKAIGPPLTDETLLTGCAQFVGTPRYMSPEQAVPGASDIDTRTDIYSLGVLLYELLTGSTPFDESTLGWGTFNGVRRILHEQEPLRPGVRLIGLAAGLSDVAARRGTEPRKLLASVRGDLEWIVMKCLEKDRTRRYGSAGGLARDLRRYLDELPVEAGPPSLGHRLAKYARRNRAALTTAAVVSLALVVGSAVSIWQAIRATRAERLMAAALAGAERDRRLAERHLDAFSLRQAQQAIEQGQVERAQKILDESRAGTAATDPRGFARSYLRRFARRQIVRIADRDGPIDHFAMAPGGRDLAYATVEGDVVLYDVVADRPRARLVGHTLPSRDLAFSPDGTRLASVGRDRDREASEVLIWDVPSGRLLTRMDRFGPGRVFSVRFTAGGRVLVVDRSSPDPPMNGVHYFDLEPDPSRPRPLPRFPHPQGISAPTPDGHILVESARRRFTRWDLLTGVESWSIAVPDAPVLDIVPDPEGRVFAIAIGGREALILDAASGEVRDRLPLSGPHIAPVVGSRAATLVFPDPSRSVLVCDRTAGRSYRIETKLAGRADPSVRAALSPDGSLLALACRGNPGGQMPVVIHEIATGRIRATYPGQPHPLGHFTFDAEGRSLFLNSGSTIQRWFFDGREPDPIPAGHANEAWAVAFSPDGRILASGSDDTADDDTIKLWDTANGRLVRGWRGEPGTVSSLSFSPDGRTLASAHIERSRNLRLWDVATGDLLATLEGHTDRVRSVAYSPDGTLLASGGSDRMVRLWDAASGRPIATLIGHEDAVHEVAFSPDGSTLASASNDRTVRLWDVAIGRAIRVLRVARQCDAVAFSPDGRALATADEGGDILLWDPATGDRLVKIHCDRDHLWTLAFTPDGQTLAAAGSSRVIHHWDVLTGQELLTLHDHAARINGLAFSPDGRTLASCSHDGAVKLWRSEDVPPSR